RPGPPRGSRSSGVEYGLELLEALDLTAVALVELGVDLGSVYLAGHMGLLGPTDLHRACHVAGVEGERFLTGLLDLFAGGLGVGVVPARRRAREGVGALLETLRGFQGFVVAQGTFDGQLDLGVTGRLFVGFVSGVVTVLLGRGGRLAVLVGGGRTHLG